MVAYSVAHSVAHSVDLLATVHVRWNELCGCPDKFDDEPEPLVTILTPTKDRRRFFPRLVECIKAQTYTNFEWIVAEDGNETVQDIVDVLPFARLVKLPRPLPLGYKRNYMKRLARGKVLIWFDDDDFHHPQRLEHSVKQLRRTSCDIVGTACPFVWVAPLMYLAKTPAIAGGTVACTRKYAEAHEYDIKNRTWEERTFIDEDSAWFVDPMQTIIVMGHSRNTCSKHKWRSRRHMGAYERGKGLNIVDAVGEDHPAVELFRGC